MSKKNIKTHNISRILVTRTDRLGDLVLSTPVFKALKEKFPNASLTGLSFLENRDVLIGNPYLDDVVLYDKKGSQRGLLGNLKFIQKLRKHKFDLVIHLHATNRMHLVTFFAGIPVRIGWDRKHGWALTQAYPDRKKEGKKHEAEYNFEILQGLSIDVPEDLESFFPINIKAQKSLDMLLRQKGIRNDKPWIVLSPSASCPSKVWPSISFGKLAEQLAAKYKVDLFAIGTESDKALIAQMQEASSVPIYDMSSSLSLGMLGAFLKQASLLISNDSGPVHVANAVGTPVISIFGRNQAGLSPTRWKPLGDTSRFLWKDIGCSQCLAHNCQIGFLCLEAISVRDVLDEVKYFESSLAASDSKFSERKVPVSR